MRPPAESHVRPKQKKRSRTGRALALFLVPVTIVLCALSGAAAAGVVGCQSWMSDFQVELGVQQLRGAIHDHPELAQHEADITRLEAMQGEGRVDILAASAFNAHIQHALREDNRVDATEAESIMVIVRDILVKRGDYTLEDYQKMTRSIESD